MLGIIWAVPWVQVSGSGVGYFLIGKVSCVFMFGTYDAPRINFRAGGLVPVSGSSIGFRCRVNEFALFFVGTMRHVLS